VGTNNECSRDLSYERSEPVGMRPFDVSRDGVHDLGGNVAEWTRDELQEYGVGCWADAGDDPQCPFGAAEGFYAYRGGSFVASAASMSSVSRLGLSGDSGGRAMVGKLFPGGQMGFRCTRPD
jgi:formylglycine-generating enzyme required for sulfatase activity